MTPGRKVTEGLSLGTGTAGHLLVDPPRCPEVLHPADLAEDGHHAVADFGQGADGAADALEHGIEA